MYRDCRMNVDCENKKVVLELSSVCNLNCKHCIYKLLDKNKSSIFIPKEKVFELIDKFVSAGINKLVLTGGEPTLHPSFIEISKYAILKISKVSICTNGVILNKDLENKVIALDFSNYTVSLDSHIEKIHDEFRGLSGVFGQTVSFLNKLKDKNKKISIHITLNPNNIDNIEKTIEFSKKMANEVAVGTIYHDTLLDKGPVRDFNKKVKAFKTKFINDPSLVLIGFTPTCKNKNCLDFKNIFMVDCKGKLVNCYWKSDEDKVPRINFEKYFITKT